MAAQGDAINREPVAFKVRLQSIPAALVVESAMDQEHVHVFFIL
jgi:hypothetical protein